ncbi:MAG TPA: ABC transporter permease [Capsulimonadaceae bacterium]|jgi:putative ABC transport system permease protein
MAVLEAIRVALDGLWANKLRSFLTMLGVIIGVFAVTLMVAVIQGARQKVIGQLIENGSNVVFAYYAPKPETLRRGGFRGLDIGDIRAVQARCPLVTAISPSVTTTVVVQAGRESLNSPISGVLPDFFRMNSFELPSGRFLTDYDNQSWAKTCILGSKIATKLFKTGSPIGHQVTCRLKGASVLLTVVGVIGPKDRGGDGTDYNNSLFAPLRTVQKRLTGSDIVDAFVARSVAVSQTAAAADQIWGVLKSRHPYNAQDFVVDTQDNLLKQIDTILMVFQLVLGSVGGLALLTGGIGIMNIMLVTVTERTREIGIRKAVGARRSMILLQFVVEAMVVSGCGGLIGIALAFLTAYITNSVQDTVYLYVPYWAALLGFGFAVGVGLFFGIYPAYRASKLDPITALRYE